MGNTSAPNGSCQKQSTSEHERDGPTAAAEDSHLRRSQLVEEPPQVGEELRVPPLIGAHRHGADIFLHRRAGDLGGRTVVAEVNDFGSRLDEFAADEVDRRIVTVVERCGGDDTGRDRRAGGRSRGPGAGSGRLHEVCSDARLARRLVSDAGAAYLMIFSSCLAPV